MSADEMFVLVLVLFCVGVIGAMAIHSNRQQAAGNKSPALDAAVSQDVDAPPVRQQNGRKPKRR